VLREQINEAVKGAMKAQEKLKLSTLRLVNAAIKNADIEAQMAQKPALTDDDILGVLQKLIKQRQDSVAAYEQGGRKELADQDAPKSRSSRDSCRNSSPRPRPRRRSRPRSRTPVPPA